MYAKRTYFLTWGARVGDLIIATSKKLNAGGGGMLRLRFYRLIYKWPYYRDRGACFEVGGPGLHRSYSTRADFFW